MAAGLIKRVLISSKIIYEMHTEGINFDIFGLIEM